MIESKISLGQIAHARSGDKGNHANIAVLAYKEAGFRWMREHLTPEVVGRYFASLKPSRVVRYEAPNVLGLNFVLYDVLAGGASRSLRVDTQGKTLAWALLHMEVKPGSLRTRDYMRRSGSKGKGWGKGVRELMNMLGAPPKPKRKKKP